MANVTSLDLSDRLVTDREIAREQAETSDCAVLHLDASCNLLTKNGILTAVEILRRNGRTELRGNVDFSYGKWIDNSCIDALQELLTNCPLESLKLMGLEGSDDLKSEERGVDANGWHMFATALKNATAADGQCPRYLKELNLSENRAIDVEVLGRILHSLNGYTALRTLTVIQCGVIIDPATERRLLSEFPPSLDRCEFGDCRITTNSRGVLQLQEPYHATFQLNTLLTHYGGRPQDDVMYPSPTNT